jgi:hypothetical protein
MRVDEGPQSSDKDRYSIANTSPLLRAQQLLGTECAWTVVYRRYQKSTDLLLRKLPFCRLVTLTKMTATMIIFRIRLRIGIVTMNTNNRNITAVHTLARCGRYATSISRRLGASHAHCSRSLVISPSLCIACLYAQIRVRPSRSLTVRSLILLSSACATRAFGGRPPR